MFYNTNSFIIQDKIIFRDLSKSGYASVCFRLKPIDIKNAKNSIKNQFGFALSSMVKSIRHPFRCQIKFGPNSEFKDMLNHYKNETVDKGDGEYDWCKSNREEIHDRYEERMNQALLLKEAVYLFISTPIQTQYTSKEISASPNKDELRQGILNVLDITFRGLEESISHLISSIATVEQLKTDELIVYHKKHYNKSLNTLSVNDILKSYDKKISIENNCYLSDYIGQTRSHENNFCGFGDHLYHDVIVVTRLPESLEADQTHSLTSLKLEGYDITVNIKPLDRKAILSKLETAFKIKNSEYIKTNEQGLRDDMDIIQERISSFKRGSISAISMDYVIHVWSPQKDNLVEKVSSLIAVLESEGFEYYKPDMASQFKGFLSRLIPGWSWSSYNQWAIDADSDDSRILPISSSFSGFSNPEVLFDSDDLGIVGLKNNFGVSFPQHMLVLAATGGGKSALIINYLSQAWDTYSFINIIDIGDSYRGLAALHNVEPIVFHPNYKWTLNLFDTLGAPLESSHKNFMSMFFRKLMGEPNDPQEGAIQGSYVMYYATDCYRVAYEAWALDNPTKLNEVAAYYIATIRRKKKTFESPEITIEDFLDTYHQSRDVSEKGHEVSLKLYNDARLDDDAITRVIAEKHHQEMLQNLSFMWFDREDFPTFTNLLNRMASHVYHLHDKSLVDKLYNLLVPYQRGGQFGGMFDGYSNIPLKHKLVYFDLDKLNSFLQEIVIFLINSSIKNYVTSMPRSTLKVSLVEELASQSKIVGAESAYEDHLSTGRKYGWQFIGVLQSWNQVEGTKFGKLLLAGVQQYLIGKQESEEDLIELAHAKKIPKTICTQIVEFEFAFRRPANDRYTNFAYIHGEEMGICRNYCNSHMLWISEFGGSKYNEKIEQIAECGSAFEALKKYA